MALDGVVKQLSTGTVIECTAANKCLEENHSPYLFPRPCLLSVNHGERCMAYPQDTTTWLIDQDTSKIKQL